MRLLVLGGTRFVGHAVVTAALGRGREVTTFNRGLSGAEVTHSSAELVWVPDERLLTYGVRQWSEMPLWRTFPGTWQVDSEEAAANGLNSRPLRSTVADTWSWMQQAAIDMDDERASEIGISHQREEEILADLERSSGAVG